MFQSANVVQVGVGWLLTSENKRHLELFSVINGVGMRLDTQHPKETGMDARMCGN
jgi:hypothetical protein